MATRFDNLPTDELLQVELKNRIELRQLRRLIAERFKIEALQTYEIGKAYQITNGRFEGRSMILDYVVVGGTLYATDQECLFPIAEGRLSIQYGTRPWTTKTQQVRLEKLDLASGFDPKIKRA